MAVYDAWAANDPVAVGALYHGKHGAADVAAARREAISYAAYRVLRERHARSRSAVTTVAVDDFTGRMVGAQCGRGVWALVQKYFDGSVVREPVRLSISRLPGGNHELRWEVLRGVFYKLQSATELGGVFGDDPGGAFQATDARVTRQEGGMGSRRFYRVLTLPAP